MLMGMLSSSGMAGTSGRDPTASSGPGSSMTSLMLPMMFTMLEQLLMKQMELLQSGKLAPTTAATASGDTSAVTQAQAQPAELRQPSILVANQTRAVAYSPASTQPAAAPVVNPAGAASTPVSVPVTSATGHADPHGEPAHGPLTQGYSSHHNGLDIGVVIGTPIHSTMAGKVVYAGWNTIGYGNLVIVQNGDYQTYYAHLSKIPVSVGQTVQAGDTIGLSGSTGNSTGPHLHYEIRYKGKNVDPTSLTLNKSI